MKRNTFIRMLPGILAMPLLLPATSCNPGSTNVQSDSLSAGLANDEVVGDYCDGCEAMYEGMPPLQDITSVANIPGKDEPGEQLIIKGSVYKPDGVTAARDIVLYIWHTDAKGYYSPSPGQRHGRRHGHLRGWLKTDADGHFQINTIRPAPYPGENIPAHLHILVKEPGKTLYYIDEVWFDDDPLVTPALRQKAEKRGGDMIIHLNKDKKAVWQAALAINLGFHIPNYK
ncbi:MAG: hypothetical protein QM781_09350 [Chitinophagaceae bacterium]